MYLTFTATMPSGKRTGRKKLKAGDQVLMLELGRVVEKYTIVGKYYSGSSYWNVKNDKDIVKPIRLDPEEEDKTWRKHEKEKQARKQAEEKARMEAEVQAKKDAEEQGNKDAEKEAEEEQQEQAKKEEEEEEVEEKQPRKEG